MATPASRQGLIDYARRQLGAPVLEINVADEQVDDIIDDSLQYFYERHFDGVVQTFLKYEITQADIDRARSKVGGVGIATTSATDSSGRTYDFYETENYIQVPPQVIGITKIFQFEGTSGLSSGMFNIKYQLFLNDLYQFSSIELLTYSMVKRQLSDIDFLLSTQKQIRFNQRQDRLYLDVDWGSVTLGEHIVLDCWRLLDPNDFTRVYNDSFLKKYLTALMKRQWGQNLIKFQGVKLPGGIELNGRQIYDDAEKDLEIIREQMSNMYELPPLDMIG